MPTIREFRDEIEAAIDAGKTLAQIRNALENRGLTDKQLLRVRRLAGTAKQRRDLASAAGKTFPITVQTAQGQASGTVTILEVDYDPAWDDALRVTFEIRRPNGNIFQLNPGQDTETVVRNGVPTHVPDGLIANPDYDPNDPSSPEQIMSYRKDYRAAVKEWIRQTVQSAVRRRGL